MAQENAASPTPLVPLSSRLGLNQGRYLGETIEIRSVLNQIQALGLKHGWQRDCFLDEPELCLTGYHRPTPGARASVYISAGIHGDEPAGPMSILKLMEANDWPRALDLWICPCLNPSGFSLNTRESAAGYDLNRQYLQPQAAEVLAHMNWLERQPQFDLALCLHEDWEAHGFYIYELNLDHRASFAEEIVRRVAEVCPIDTSPVIEGREAHGGIIRPSADPLSRPQWPEAFYLINYKTRLSYTLEAPSDFPLATRVAALVTGVRTVLERYQPSAEPASGGGHRPADSP